MAVLSLALLITAPYLVDLILAPRLTGFEGTLAFPCAATTAWYLWALVSPSGTWLNPAYTQYGNLPLLQVASVTGVWGITFLMAWLASVVNWAWERDFAWRSVRRGGLLYATVVSVVLLSGGAQLALFLPSGGTVPVAGVSPSEGMMTELDRQLSRTPERAVAQANRSPMRP